MMSWEPMNFEAPAATCQENKAHESPPSALSKLFLIIITSAASPDTGSQHKINQIGSTFFLNGKTTWEKTLAFNIIMHNK